MIVQGITVDGSFFRLKHAPLLAEALKLFERANGYLPLWGRETLAEIDSAKAAAPTSGAEATEARQRSAVRTMSPMTYIGTADAAERLGITPRAVVARCPNIEGAYLHGRVWRIPEDEIEKRRKAER